jgi:hypothetical protein
VSLAKLVWVPFDRARLGWVPFDKLRHIGDKLRATETSSGHIETKSGRSSPDRLNLVWHGVQHNPPTTVLLDLRQGPAHFVQKIRYE